MSTKMQITAKLDQRLTMSHQLMQAINLLQYNTLDLKQLIQYYLENNPFIEADEATIHEQENENNFDNQHYTNSNFTKHYQTSQQTDDLNTIENYAIPKNLREHLLEQTLMSQFNATDQLIAEAIIDALDESGKLTMTLADIQQSCINQTHVELNEFEKVLAIIQTYDPAGIAHQDLRECLLIQLSLMNDKDAIWQIAYDIVKTHFDLLADNKLKKIQHHLKCKDSELIDGLHLIRSLDPKPGLQYVNEHSINIEPDLYVKKIKDEWHVFLTNNVLTNIKINKQYQQLMKDSKQHVSYESLNKELQEAQWLMKGLQRRNDTLFNVANFIVQHQKDFFDYGHAFMKPMNIIDVSQALNLHESTVSRVTTGKYIATPRGMLELKYFFPSYVLTESGETCSATSVKELIKDIISQETKKQVFSDDEIALLLKDKGINIARRTVAKYREAMKILSSYQRSQQMNRFTD